MLDGWLLVESGGHTPNFQGVPDEKATILVVPLIPLEPGMESGKQPAGAQVPKIEKEGKLAQDHSVTTELRPLSPLQFEKDNLLTQVRHWLPSPHRSLPN